MDAGPTTFEQWRDADRLRAAGHLMRDLTYWFPDQPTRGIGTVMEVFEVEGRLHAKLYSPRGRVVRVPVEDLAARLDSGDTLAYVRALGAQEESAGHPMKGRRVLLSEGGTDPLTGERGEPLWGVVEYVGVARLAGGEVLERAHVRTEAGECWPGLYLGCVASGV